MQTFVSALLEQGPSRDARLALQHVLNQLPSTASKHLSQGIARLSLKVHRMADKQRELSREQHS